MTETENYQLNQWDAADPVRRGDFNSDNAKLDAALKEHAGQLDALAAAVARCGNCKIYTTSYVGTGESGGNHPNSLTFPWKPALAIVGINSCFSLLLFPCDSTYNWLNNYYSIKWNGNTVTWYGNGALQLNEKGTTYYVVAFLPVDE